MFCFFSGENIVYLDNAGSPICSPAVINRYAQDLASNIYGNPHSGNAAGISTSESVQNVRSR